MNFMKLLILILCKSYTFRKSMYHNLTYIYQDLVASSKAFINNPITIVLPVSNPDLSLIGALLWLLVISAVFCWMMSIITDNLSQIDRFWSILPPLYSWIITIHEGRSRGFDKITTLIGMSIVASVWGARLTYQFIKKDGYTLAGEDYRWKYIKEEFRRRRCNRILYQLFNLFFIVIYQSVLLLMLVMPQLVLAGQTHLTLTPTDYLLLGFYLLLVLIESIADHQQQEFQHHKYAALRNGIPLRGHFKDGFLQSGLFAYCRHPNYVCEVLLWWVFGGMSVTRVGVTWSLVGAFNLATLFTGSQEITEQISCRKYPMYRKYQATVPSFIPNVQVLRLSILSDGRYTVTSDNKISKQNN